MPSAYPYTISNNKIEPMFNRVRTAARPDRFSIRETLHKWGFTATNDRALIGVLKELGFLNEGGTPTAAYDGLRDPSTWKRSLGEQMRQTYSDLFAIDRDIHKASDSEIKGAISRVTGKDDDSVKRYYSTFKTLANLADFSLATSPARHQNPDEVPPAKDPPPNDERSTKFAADFHYNIQIHLPVTTDISVYNAIFKSIKDNLSA